MVGNNATLIVLVESPGDEHRMLIFLGGPLDIGL